MLNKPATFGIKIFTICDARTFYTLGIEIYPGIQRLGRFRPWISEKDVVLRLTEPIFGSGRNITIDNWYTSFFLGMELLDKNITLFGTMKKNGLELPFELTYVKGKAEKHIIRILWKHIHYTILCINKIKNVIIFSAIHPNSTEIDSTTEAKKPEIITLCNWWKVELKLLINYVTCTVSRRTRCWLLAGFLEC